MSDCVDRHKTLEISQGTVITDPITHKRPVDVNNYSKHATRHHYGSSMGIESDSVSKYR